MKLGSKGRYAVMAMVDLAMYGCEKPVPLSDVAGRQEISVPYLEQLFAKMRRHGLVKSVRGPGGGYILGHTPEELRISDIVRAVDETLKQTRCSTESATGCSGSQGRCVTHDLWEELGNQIHLFLSSVTLADVVARRVLGTSGMLHRENHLEQRLA